MNELIKILTDLIARRFYGKIIITFENGKIRIIRKEETLKLDQTTGKTGGLNE